MKQYIVTAESLNVRSGPSSDDPKVWVFPFGKIITQVSTNPDSSWIEVKLGEIQGWVSSQFLSEVPAGTIETDPSTLLGNDLGIDWFKWNQKAMLISASFEGHGADWGNPVGNFDRAFLTCGLLGFTWEWNNQPPMVMEFVVRQGKAALTALMPTKGAEYLDAVILGSKQAAPIVSSWSIGEKVVEPYHSELKTFWSSDAMKKIQTETSVSMFAKFAKRKTTETQRYYGLATPQFAHFAYWFDQAVINGSEKTQPFERAEIVGVDDVFNWMNTARGWTQMSFNKNLEEWPATVAGADAVQVKLWKLAYLRSAVASETGDTVTMCRRGSLALGEGWINDSKRNFLDDFGWNNVNPVAAPMQPPTNANSVNFIELASSVGQITAARRLVQFRSQHNMNGNPRYWAIVDFSKPSREKRFYLFDTQAPVADQAISLYFVAHGKGSDSLHTGVADVFLNVQGSNCSSLGIYRCQDPYDGEHGPSLRLTGLEPSNSNAADRGIVLHGAEYVSQAFINDVGKLGRSEGCFAVEMGESAELSRKLSLGSNIIAWRS